MQFSLPCILHKAVGNGSFRVDALFFFSLSIYGEREAARAYFEKHVGRDCVCCNPSSLLYATGRSKSILRIYCTIIHHGLIQAEENTGAAKRRLLSIYVKRLRYLSIWLWTFNRINGWLAYVYRKKELLLLLLLPLRRYSERSTTIEIFLSPKNIFLTI